MAQSSLPTAAERAESNYTYAVVVWDNKHQLQAEPVTYGMMPKHEVDWQEEPNATLELSGVALWPAGDAAARAWAHLNTVQSRALTIVTLAFCLGLPGQTLASALVAWLSTSHRWCTKIEYDDNDDETCNDDGHVVLCFEDSRVYL